MHTQGSPWSGCETTEKAQRVLGRLREAFGVEALPASLETLAGSESGLNDLYMNLKRQLADGAVTAADKMIVAIGVAAAAGSKEAVDYLAAAARNAGVGAQHLLDAVSVAAVCSIFNSFYGFQGVVEGEEFKAFRAPFNAQAFGQTTLSTAQVEMICIAVSAINHCEICVNGHIQKARSIGMTNEQIDETVRAGAAARGFAVAAGALGGA